MSTPPTELALPQVSELPLDHIEELLSVLPVVSEVPLPLLVPMLVEAMIPLFSEEDKDEPVVEDNESLPPTPALTLAEATPGTPPLTDPPAFQLSLCPAVSELLVVIPVELPSDMPLVLEAELPSVVLLL